MKTLERLKSALSTKTPKAADLEAALVEARRLHAEATTERDRLAGKRREALLGPDDALAKHRAAVAAAEDRAETAGAYVSELGAKLAEVAAENAERERRTRYDAAKALAEAAAKELPAAYQAIVAQAHVLLRRLAEAQIAVAAANADLPSNVEYLVEPEMAVRGTPTIPGKVLKTEVVERWRHPLTMKPVDEEIEEKIIDAGNDKGL